MFDGKVNNRKVDFGGKRVKADSRSVLDQSKKLREQRQQERERIQAIRKIQCLYRGFICRKKCRQIFRQEMMKKVQDIHSMQQLFQQAGRVFLSPPNAICQLLNQFLYVGDELEQSRELLVALLTLLVDSLLTRDAKSNFLSCNPESSLGLRAYEHILMKFLHVVGASIAVLPLDGALQVLRLLTPALSLPIVHQGISPALSRSLLSLTMLPSVAAMTPEMQGLIQRICQILVQTLSLPGGPQVCTVARPSTLPSQIYCGVLCIEFLVAGYPPCFIDD